MLSAGSVCDTCATAALCHLHPLKWSGQGCLHVELQGMIAITDADRVVTRILNLWVSRRYLHYPVRNELLLTLPESISRLLILIGRTWL